MEFPSWPNETIRSDDSFFYSYQGQTIKRHLCANLG